MKKLWIILSVAGVAILALSLFACAPAPTPTPEPTQVPPPEVPSATPLPDQSAYFTAWAANPMRAVYDLSRGPNTMCSRCHSPYNWIPTSKPGASPNCITCKFPGRAMTTAPTFAEGGMDLVTEEQWIGIPCKTCHRVDPETGYVSPEIAFLEPVTLVYEEVNTPTELCEKCHNAPVGAHFGASTNSAAQHYITTNGSAHMNYAGEWPQADRPKYCTDCHDIHTGKYKQCVDCHTDTAATHTKVAAMMGNVTCLACHDASGLDAAPMQFDPNLEKTASTDVTNLNYNKWVAVTDPAKAQWVPVTKTTSTAGVVTVKYTLTHMYKWYVNCDKCHKAGNTYGLSVRKADGSLVPTPTPKPAVTTAGTPGAATTAKPAATATK